MLIAIDGPAGAGKSTVARAVARALGFSTWTPAPCTAAVGARRAARREPADRVQVTLGERVLLDGEDVTEAIRTPEVTEVASRGRRATRRCARRWSSASASSSPRGDWVAEGRDIGTVVAPDAELKVFLTATPRGARAPPRGRSSAPTRRVLASSAMRDERDRTREHSPLRPRAGRRRARHDRA